MTIGAHRPRVTVGAILAFGALLVGALPTSAAPAAGDDAMTITRVDLSGYPQASIEVSAPAGLVGDATTADFSVTENGQPVATEVTKVPTNSLEVVLLIDISGSMAQGRAINAAKSAAIEFLNSLPPEVAVGVVAFNSRPSMISSLSLDRTFLAAAINNLKADGETSLYDAIVFAQTLFSGGTTDRQMVVLSDGGDTVSKATLDEAVAVSANIRTSAVELVSSEANHDSLARLTAAGNGTLSSVSDPAALVGLYQKIANALVDRYRLTFTSTASGPAEYTVTLKAGKTELQATASATAPVVASTTSTVVVTTTTGVYAPNDTTTAVAVGSSAGHSSSSTLLLVGALVFFLSIALLVLMLRSGRPEPEPTSQELTGSGLNEKGGETDGGLGDRLSTAAEKLLDSKGRRRKLSDRLEIAGIPLRPGEFLLVAGGLGLAGSLLLAVLIPVVGLFIGALLTFVCSSAYITVHIDRRREAFAEQLPDILQLLVSSLRAGYALLQALDSVSAQCPEPARAEFRRVLFEVRIGRDLKDSLDAMAKRMACREFDFVVSAIEINREVGGQLAGVLDTIAETIRDRQKLQRQIRVLTADGRMSVAVLTALPLFLVLMLSLVNRTYFKPLAHGVGPYLIILAVLLTFLGWIWMRRIIKAQE